MECKNCELPLRTDYSHCPACGAKIIRNRLTIKNLWFDFTERFFNIDNTFFLTFKHLCIKPEVVIVGYIQGVRKRYMNPISYFTIAVFLGGIFFFLNKKFFPDAMNYQFTQIAYSGSDEAQKFSLGLMKNFQDILQEYQNLFYIGMLPFLAIISKLVFFNKKQFNLSEHFVINIYAYSQMSILINILYILSIWNSKLIYWEATINSLFLLIYFSYVYKRTLKLNWGQILLKLMLFLLIFGVLFVAITFGIGIYLALFTDTFEHLKPS